MVELRRYRTVVSDSALWADFRFRTGDVVISTPAKCGTTWMQMLCALLIFDTADFGRPLTEVSPWLDAVTYDTAATLALLESQQHRRFVKTHTPLDGIPLDDRATYVVVARHPLDMAVSLYHHSANIDRRRMAELTGAPLRTASERPSAHDWLLSWTRRETTPMEEPDSLVGVLHHVGDAWSRRATAPKVVLVHYADLLADLPGEMGRLASRLEVEVSPERLRVLAEAATFAQMRARSSELSPNRLGVLKDDAAFFRSGRSGAGRELLSAEELASYDARVASLADPELVAWLHR